MDMQAIRDTFRHHVPTLQQVRGESAVLVPLVMKNDALSLLYEVRSQSIEQPGEVCFPGGRIEPGETPRQCALRETWEELGIPDTAIEILGLPDYLHIRGDRILHPVLGLVDSDALAHLTLSGDEVADTFTVPLDWLREHPPTIYRHRQQVEIPGFPVEEVGITEDYRWFPHYLEIPIYHGLPYPLWGLTARITYWLLETVAAYEKSNGNG